MNFERNLRQTATYWGPGVGTDIYGAQAFAEPVQLNCRWEDTAELFIDKTGVEVASKSKVFFADDISLEGYLYLGESTEEDPRAVLGGLDDDGLTQGRAFEIRMVKRIPDLKAVKTMYVAFL